MSIDIHKSRIFDLAIGMGSGLERVTKLLRLRNLEMIKKEVADFRKSFIDSTNPSIYILDITNDIVNPIVNSLGIDDIKTFTEEITKEIEKIYSKTNSKDLVSIITTAEEKANNKFIALKSGNYTKDIYLEYRNVVRQLGKDISGIFSDRVIVRLTDPESIGQSGKLVLIGKTFSGMKDNLNKAINSYIKTKYGNKDFSYGSLRVAGHTAVEVGSKSFRINTPLIQETLLRLEAGGLKGKDAFDNIENSFTQSVPLFMKHKITFNETFTPTATTLLDIGFSFVVSMDPTENSKSGSSDERAAVKSIISGRIFPELVETLQKRVGYLKDNILNIKNSPKPLEYITELIIASLLNKKANSHIDISSSSKTQQIGSLVLPKLPNGSSIKKITKTPSSNVAVVNVPKESTVNLLSLLRAHIADQVQQNMGKGDARSVLNYRSGRFANSVSIERLTTSREGMVSVFYNYMRNPYGTFSDGGEQQSPRSRDPKTLISKSIREIGASAMYNRMRAVLV
jgi:hypothetical protein